ncbi:MAG: efflux RND transporter periplasmic adaptor subunit [cyanobacterium endosymbiont of Rhopalodia musculus]|uniref:efflux RND transporter periplasmic adaptor subunit n=1 Tax=cyanobacterium endosymbiont of Epithemia clementina EcSB TaxID=3034674 RepID=UPI00247FB9E6|nr:efflux RND transporter periplasmic adaptor subunit [cyanobacterium endosymbiont of Epithemia clementina EcSB]WGT66945.1 efflux RND transporter periplasmic adaptor subunit [cyanobacterium endosymbiont of Epithemia clementina EcSB]
MSNPKQFIPKLRRWPMILSLLLFFMGGGLGMKLWLTSRGTQENLESLAAQLPTPVKLLTLTQKTIQDTSKVIGTIEARDAVVIKPEIEGRISQILVQEGDYVQQGQLIIDLDSSNWHAELLEVKAQLAREKARLAELQAGNRSEDLAEARASLQEAEVRLANAQGGARPEEIAQAQAQLEEAEAKAQLAQQRVKRYDNLQKEGAISTDEFQEYTTEARSTKAEVEQAKGRLAQLIENRQSDINQLAAVVERHKQNLRRLKRGARLEVIAQAEADVAENLARVRIAEVNVNKTRIIAPISGIIGEIPVKVGDYIKQGDIFTTLTANKIVELNLSIPLEKVPQLQLGLPVEILDLSRKPTLKGRISFISPYVTANSQLILAKATFNNIQQNLLNHQFIEARIIWNKRPGLLIPANAVSHLGAQTFVFVAQVDESFKSDKPKLVAKQRQVILGSLQGNNYQVLNGLKAGEKIITAGILRLRDGAVIQPLDSK